MEQVSTKTFVGAIASCVLLAGSTVGADITLKTGTLAPDSSIWARSLREMGEGWKKGTSGRVTMMLFAGTAGSEERIVRSLRIRQLHVAQLSAIQLSEIDDAFNVLGLPMFFQSYEELDHVLGKLSPLLEQRLEAKGLKVLNWGYAGWVHVFSSAPVRTPDDLRKLKLYTSAGDDSMASWYRQNGFNPVPIDASQMFQSLTTRMIQAVPMTPLSAQMFMWYEHAPYMMDVGFAPLVGATVISLDAWQRIDAADRQVVVDEARKAGGRLRAEIPRLDAEAVIQMKNRKLTVTTGSQVEWRNAADRFGSTMRDRLVPGDVYDLARRERDAHRASAKNR